jgi:hypothetical protein
MSPTSFGTPTTVYPEKVVENNVVNMAMPADAQ